MATRAYVMYIYEAILAKLCKNGGVVLPTTLKVALFAAGYGARAGKPTSPRAPIFAMPRYLGIQTDTHIQMCTQVYTLGLPLSHESCAYMTETLIAATHSLCSWTWGPAFMNNAQSDIKR